MLDPPTSGSTPKGKFHPYTKCFYLEMRAPLKRESDLFWNKKAQTFSIENVI